VVFVDALYLVKAPNTFRAPARVHVG